LAALFLSLGLTRDERKRKEEAEMKGHTKRACEAGFVALAFFGFLAGCAGEATHPLAPVEEGSYLPEISFLERRMVAPGLSGDGNEVSFTVTPEEGGIGELDFISFEVEANIVKQDVTVTISAEDPRYYLIELSSESGAKLRKGTLTFRVDPADLQGEDAGSLAVYMETKHGWQQLAAEWNPDENEMVVNTGKYSRYALSRE
jgi:hypothetical protein